jgi:flagellar biosynthesis/type III secretory pathway M-ring protein FliF/YscJ
MSATASTAPQNKSLEWMNRLRANPKIPLIVAGAAAIAILVAMVLWAKSLITGRSTATFPIRMAAPSSPSLPR